MLKLQLTAQILLRQTAKTMIHILDMCGVFEKSCHLIFTDRIILGARK